MEKAISPDMETKSRFDACSRCRQFSMKRYAFSLSAFID
jgi:hypothetical protein